MVNGSEIVEYAKKFIGVPYVSLVQHQKDLIVLVQFNMFMDIFSIKISRTTKTQINDGREVGRNELQPGDLVFPS